MFSCNPKIQVLIKMRIALMIVIQVSDQNLVQSKIPSIIDFSQKESKLLRPKSKKKKKKKTNLDISILFCKVISYILQDFSCGDLCSKLQTDRTSYIQQPPIWITDNLEFALTESNIIHQNFSGDPEPSTHM